MASLGPDSRPNLPAPGADTSPSSDDPFVSNDTPVSTAHYRFSTFDHDLFTAGPGSSPRQAKRALEAHLAETDRRLDEAGKLGTALVNQRKALTEQLQEVEKLHAQGELSPDLRTKLVDIEKEYNDLTRDSARAFLPKQRVPSNETGSGSPHVADGARSGRRSVSPSKFESQAFGSPTKLSVPNRKIRNQPSSRVHDIEFAAEISTSLIAQVRNLQALLADRDEEVRDLKHDKSTLEIETENLQQRLKTLDESEHRYKEENWNLETRMQEASTQQREASDREKKLTQALSTSNAEKSAAQKELDEVKLSHARLVEEHTAAIKHHDIELGTAKRSAVMAEGERAVMQRKIDDLTNQNTELAKAFSTQRGRTLERENMSGTSDDDFETAADNATPEHSPPPSPIKGTPRHAMLETETMKTSLQHAQRTIQSQRSLIHREKTEKLELRRIIQDLRDDLERKRADSGASGVHRRSKKAESKDLKKTARLLGSFRSSQQEIFMDDPEWEDQAQLSPRTLSANVSPATKTRGDFSAPDSTDQFDTANEASESAFETANERATETEDFQTTNEQMSDSDDGAATETETTSRGFGKMQRPPNLPAGLSRHMSKSSTHSTATSEEEDAYEAKTPTGTAHSHRTSRFLLNRGPFDRSSRHGSEEPNLRSSPTSMASNHSGTPQAGGQSLFAELQNFAGSDEESVGNGTPSRRSARSATPGSIRRRLSPVPLVPSLPKVLMVDSGTMTEPMDDTSLPALPAAANPTADHTERPTSMQSVIADPQRASWLSTATGDSRPLSQISYSDVGAQHDPDMEAKLAAFPVPPTLVHPQPELGYSNVHSEHIEPREEEHTPTAIEFTLVVTESVEPVAEPEVVLPTLSLSAVSAQHIEPIAEPVAPQLTLGLSTVSSEHIEPVQEPEPPVPKLAYTAMKTANVEPVDEPEIVPPALALSNIFNEKVDPVAEPEVPLPTLALSAIGTEQVEPIEAPEPEAVPLPAIIPAPVPSEPEKPALPSLNFTNVQSEHVKPIIEPEVVVPAAPLAISAIQSQDWEPRAEPEIVMPQPALGFTVLQSQQVEPVEEPSVPQPALTLSPIRSENLEPIAEAGIPQAPQPLSFAGLTSQHVEPVAEPGPLPPGLGFSGITTHDVLPVVELPPTLPRLILSPIAAEGVTPASPVEVNELPNFGFSSVESVDTRPITPRSPWREAFIMPRDKERTATPDRSMVASFDIHQDDSPGAAQNETRQMSGTEEGAKEFPQPFREISGNAENRNPQKQTAVFSDQSAQTSLTAEAIDKLINAGSRSGLSHVKHPSVGSVDTPGTTGTVRIHRPAEERTGSPTPKRTGGFFDAGTALIRPGSATSGRDSAQDAPPLPNNHRELIEAARTGSANGPKGDMGPPMWPASAMKGHRPRTPSLSARPASNHSARAVPTLKGMRSSSTQGQQLGVSHSPTRLTARSRQSSVSSFVSELDTRFNMRPGEMVDPTGLGSNADPRMIQAITQTMIGEYLWKYTRKTGRGEMSEKRHRRYFWVHPYTRTLYWSDRDPATAGSRELKAKSVPIEAVRVVTDDNPMPPGLHRKSLVIISPGRTIKFTCTTGQRHETWFNSLSYLLMRTNGDGQNDAEDMAHNITQDDVDEFNPQYGQRQANGTRPRAPPSLSSYNSRTTHNQSPAGDYSMNVPTLTPRTPAQRPSALNKLFRSSGSKFSGTFSSFRGRASAPDTSIYEASEVHDSAEDLREMIERQDREADRLENVRACCDGKHDVGQLHHHSVKKRGAQSAPHQPPSNAPTAPFRSRS
ncbi:Anucleate primary sterigmata protein A-like protein [Emericellopsis cladophorae]|uniref:Anucleate primary sterigmata protein A-like protein n=1 Tax=Emericellopsis cladophorae TaxID=2686198 RepID=A0A9P9XZ80_9HYPO|nr:Anucleate primary sterigmata protein A-like protein [Emericellopsis cladophorae]KAI6780582.1 Anucleate primary sterigmata protein A-like protein [Emericellopsis cladophorae]